MRGDGLEGLREVEGLSQVVREPGSKEAVHTPGCSAISAHSPAHGAEQGRLCSSANVFLLN